MYEDAEYLEIADKEAGEIREILSMLDIQN